MKHFIKLFFIYLVFCSSVNASTYTEEICQRDADRDGVGSGLNSDTSGINPANTDFAGIAVVCPGAPYRDPAGIPPPQYDIATSCETVNCTSVGGITYTGGVGVTSFEYFIENDNCPTVANPSQANNDGDGMGDACDNCPFISNGSQANADGDSEGDSCDTDDDNDGVLDVTDNCPLISNASQTNTDGDSQGDACDTDNDNDGVPDASDNCPLIVNSGQLNTDGDSFGNDCDSDDDNDLIEDVSDNCPLHANNTQTDTDGDSQGDACDADDDNDGVADVSDALPLNPAESVDTDSDGIGNNADTDDDNDGALDVSDNCSLISNATQTNTDGDSQGDACDTDDDNDGVLDVADNCSLISNASQTNTDGDAQGDTCDIDDDNDTVLDGSDNCPLDGNTTQANMDGDSQGNACDMDDDDDTVLDGSDNCPLSVNTSQIDSNANGQGNACEFPSIALGYYHSCVLMAGGGVQCWGDNSFRQMGDGTGTDRSTQVTVSGLSSGVQAIAAGYAHTCALTTAGGVKCWGYNVDGRLGDGSTTQQSVPVAVAGLSSEVQAIAAGKDHSCALTIGGGVKCWGNNNYGQLGDGTTTASLIPVTVSGLSSGVQAIAAADDRTCVITFGGGVKCWGNNNYGQLGDGTTTASLIPVAVVGLSSGVQAISAKGSHSCALTTTGGIKCWGLGLSGQLGNGFANNSLTPVAVSGLSSGVQAISAGDRHTCALTTAGGAKCWGYNYYGRLGDNSSSNSAIPVAVYGLSSGVQAIGAGYEHSCAKTTTSGVKCWGRNYYDQLGDGTGQNSDNPVAVFRFAQSILVTTAAPNSVLSVGINFPVAATSSSGLLVNITVTGDCSISGNTVTMTNNVTPCTVNYNQAGNEKYAAATQVSSTTYVDADNDGAPDISDAFPLDATETIDTDSDAIGNNADTDDDNDGVADASDNCSLVSNVTQTNTDGDGQGDACDTDDDDDTKLDGVDNCPLISNASQTNTDGDSQGDACDTDDDNDGVTDTQEGLQGTNPLLADSDGDTVSDAADNCALVSNATQTNTDGDSQGDACDTDDDNDGVLDASDNCALASNATQTNTDGDSQGDACDTDDDNDTKLDGVDNCPLISNASQTNTDGDGQGDACDTDDDNDGVLDVADNCSLVSNVTQTNTDGDSQGDACDTDDDNDTKLDGVDNCPLLSNASQTNTDGDSQGDACDTDDDNDGVTDTQEGLQGTNPLLADSDGDTVSDAADNCALVSNASQANTDGDSQGDACDTDDDNDGVLDASDNCALVSNATQTNTDGDSQGDACDTDDDNDGVLDASDNCSLISNATQTNTDGDSQGDACDTDDDNDGVLDGVDNCSLISNASQTNTDGDGQGDACDSTPTGDSDSDGIDNLADNCPLISNATQTNTDGDSQGDACDTDDDNDGVLDVADNCSLVSNVTQTNTDGDGQGDACDTDDDNDAVADGSDNCPLIANTNQLDWDSDGNGDRCDTTVPTPADIAGVHGKDKAGTSVAFAGDFNGDGYGDYVIGIPSFDLSTKIKDAGRAEVISGKDGAVLAFINGIAAKDALGFAVAGNSDVNDDGLDDVVVGAPKADHLPLKDNGSVTLLYGRADINPVVLSNQVFYGATVKTLFGSALALGYVNNDSHADIVVGAPKADDVGNKRVDAGSVTIIDGSTLAALPNVYYGSATKAYAGTAVAVGNVDAVAGVDIIIGAPNDDDIANNRKDTGSVTVYNIATTTPVIPKQYGAVAKAYFGKSVAAGNVDGVTGDEVLVGAPGDDNALMKDAGSVTVFFTDATPSITKYGTTTKAGLGNSVAVGDVNNDGNADIIAGAKLDDKPTAPKVTKDVGSVSVWSGNGYTPIGSTLYGSVSKDYFGTSVGAGDINSDGKADLIIGIPGFDLPATPTTKIIKDVGQVKAFSGAGL